MNRGIVLRGLAVVGLATALAGGIALAANIDCATDPAPACQGTEENDTITGSNNRDEIVALGGNDNIQAGNGFDVVKGGDGEDVLDGGANNNDLFGQAGNDLYHGGDAVDFMQEDEDVVSDDVMNGGAGRDYLVGGGGNDTLNGGDGDDAQGTDPGMWGDRGNDTLDGGPGDDTMEGEQGNDTYLGGEGDDFIFGTANESRRGKDEIHCGGGVDEVLANKNDIVDADCEEVHRFPNPTKANKADRRAAKAAQERVTAEFLARRDAAR